MESYKTEGNLAYEIAEKNHFMHWGLEFADLFAERGGFDLIIGNPPWVKMTWNEQSVFSDKYPMFAVKKLTAAETARHRVEALKNPIMYELYFDEFESMSGTQSFLNASQNYLDLKGQQTNLFKCFLPQAWMFCGNLGVSAFVHPDGVFNDPNGGFLREKLYSRLRKHFQFTNELKLFPEVDHHMGYSLNVYSNKGTTEFDLYSIRLFPKSNRKIEWSFRYFFSISCSKKLDTDKCYYDSGIVAKLSYK